VCGKEIWCAALLTAGLSVHTLTASDTSGYGHEDQVQSALILVKESEGGATRHKDQVQSALILV